MSGKITKTLFIVILLVLAALLSVRYISYVTEVTTREITDKAISIARASETGFRNEVKAGLHDAQYDQTSGTLKFEQLSLSLAALADVSGDIHCAYIYSIQDNQVFVLADSGLSADAAHLRLSNSRNDEQFIKPIQTGNVHLTEPHSDSMGTWISVLVPMKAFGSETPYAVFAVDYPISLWRSHTAIRIAQAGIVILFLVIVTGALWIAIRRNITLKEQTSERMKIEEELKERERSNAMLLSNLPGMAYRCKFDRNWTMLFVSDGCFELTGYKPEQLLFNRDISFNDLINKEYQDVLWDIWVRTLSERLGFKQEYALTTATGEVKWVFEQGRGVYDENGEVLAIEGIIIDISEQKKREEEILYLSHHDMLTGLYNRSYFENALKIMDKEEMLPLSTFIADIDGIKFINDAFGQTAGDRAIKSVGTRLSKFARDTDVLARIGGDEFCILLPDTSYEEAEKIMKQIEAAFEAAQRSEKDIHVNISLGHATKENAAEDINKVLKLAEDNMRRNKLLQNRSSHSALLASMKATLFEKSQETEAHAQRLIELSRAIGTRMNLSEQQLKELELLSTLHDIGKIGISDVILKKPGKLTKEEWAEMKRHPEIGYRIAMSSPELNSLAEYILSHHERWDGTGYPQGLWGEEIPLLARILSIADAFDAMTEDRSYRRAMTREAAAAEIIRCSGSQFDPQIALLFIEEVLLLK